ncbi:trichohyalin isoform X2 [Ananas comosus]|uniref:Trichohyalin isoform X2 n=1 Tax=Ananas comosus TaxID=4615 RepID=A0A6P5FLP8_ANACO|nr:trichohyalin isoform X2 [Ananas comosus]
MADAAIDAAREVAPPPPPKASEREIRPSAAAAPSASSASSSASASSNPDMEAPPPKPRRSMASSDPKSEIQAVARKLADQPVENPDSAVWAVLTAISKSARKRPQGMNILLRASEHCLGRTVEDKNFRIPIMPVSGNHCRIFKDPAAVQNGELNTTSQLPVFLKDTSTNGTYLNWTKLRKDSPQARLHHGDIISFVAAPHCDSSYAFVYREVRGVTFPQNGNTVLKRKAEENAAESKRFKGIGIGSPDGPVSLDDVRSLQRSNTELRQQLESHVLTMEILRSENRASAARHENELKELKDVVANSYLDQLKELQHELDENKKELNSRNTSNLELRNSIKDLNERLSALKQSRVDADEIIQSQKATISELEVQLKEERNMRREEREDAEKDLKLALQKVQAEAQEEIKRQSDVYLRQQREQQEVINKLQESEKDVRSLVGALRSKLEDTRESLVASEKKVRQLEVQLHDEQLASANSRKRSETLESELKSLKDELESEKVAREEAWAKVSALELEIAAAIRDLSTEKQRFQGARERIILRETQLRAFYSTTEEISALFAKQQEQLKAMQKTLEDEENDENASFGIDMNAPLSGNMRLAHAFQKETASLNSKREALAASPNKEQASRSSTSHDDDNVSNTEKHDCLGSQEGNTQDLECTSSERFFKGFGSDIEAVPAGEPTDTERVLGTESQVGEGGFCEKIRVLQKCNNTEGETMQLDDETQFQDKEETQLQEKAETQLQENAEIAGKLEDPTNGSIGGSQSRIEDTQNNTIRTADLLASEVPGSWAMSTAPSVNGENESPRNTGENDNGDGENTAAAATLLLCSEVQAAGSQSHSINGATKLTKDQEALNAMIAIVAPDFGQQLESEGGKSNSMSDAETEEGDNDGDATDDDSNAKKGSDVNDDDDYGDNAGDDNDGDGAGDGDEAMIEDSVG